MPSGKRVDWSKYDHLIKSELPSYTIVNFTAKYIPHLSSKAVGARAKKLGIKPAPKKLSEEHKKSISKAQNKITDESIQLIKKYYGSCSIYNLEKIVGLTRPTIYKVIHKYNISKNEFDPHMFPAEDQRITNRKNWEKLDKIIKKNISTLTITQLAKEINADKRTLGKRLLKLGLKAKKYQPSDQHKFKISESSSRDWSRDELEYLLSNIDIKSISEISKDLSIHRSNIWRKLKELGYEHNPDSVKSKHSRRVSETLCRPDIKNKLSTAARGRILSNDHKSKISKSLKQRWAEPDVRSMYLDHRRSDDVRRKLAEALAKQPSISSIQHKLYNLLDYLNIKFSPEGENTVIGYYSVDCIIHRSNNRDIIIECQGDYWHNISRQKYLDRAKFTYINTYFEHEYEIMYIWEKEFENEEKLSNRIKSKLSINPVNDFKFNDVQIEEVKRDDVKSLLDAYHYLGSNRGGKAYGAFLDDNIIAAALFSPPVRQNTMNKFKKEYIELSRFCIDPAYQKKNFASWFLSRLLKIINKPIVSYSDSTMGHVGTIYKATNFTFSHKVKPDYWYQGPNNHIMKKKSLYNKAKDCGLTEREYAEKNGFVKIFGREKLCFTFGF